MRSSGRTFGEICEGLMVLPRWGMDETNWRDVLDEELVGSTADVCTMGDIGHSW